ncbi:hypothetical protein HHO41_21960 [Bacillus sp. DNRA2]|uniref:hypothetical protein n=1 Tax=Bacillus sp. DNRA2 TaxID=2723053 RepID=UPI00145F6921|nr:hypothetical protein [Bacillus sp. DNRA2]NMD72884.1 hypothetical protein [Bacillus sp. DNRA2]
MARVDQQVNTEYRHSVMIETENGQKEVSTPYTNYKITVVKNIKGNIKKDKSIPITKAGGVDKDNSSVILFEDDNLPETNKLYVFLAYAQEDGSLLVSGPNSNILVGNSNKSEISTNLPLDEKASKVISSYEKAKTNQVVRERIHFTSNFDENK